MRPSLAAFAALVASAALTACGETEPTTVEDPAFTGVRAFVSTGEDAYVGVAANGEAFSIYACSGTADAPGEVHLWFGGDIGEGDAFTADHESGATLEGEFDGGDGVTGTITLPGGATIPLDGFPVDPDADDQGLFRGEGTDADGEAVVAGWVLASADDQRGSLLFVPDGTLAVVSRLPPGEDVLQQDTVRGGVPLTVTNRVDLFR